MTDLKDPPHKCSGEIDADALIEEARQHQRRRYVISGSAIGVLVFVIALVLITANVGGVGPESRKA